MKAARRTEETLLISFISSLPRLFIIFQSGQDGNRLTPSIWDLTPISFLVCSSGLCQP